jgi:hypothetical protein
MLVQKALVLTVSTVAFARSIHIRQTAAPEGSSILDVQTSGNGCPHDTTNVTINANQTVTVQNLTGFQVESGPGRQKGSSKNCAVHVSLSYPDGYQFQLVQSGFIGKAALDPGVQGSFFSSFFYSKDAGNVVRILKPL